MTILRTRTPTGARSWPVLLVEGPEKCGRTRACAALAASPRVGRTLWLDLGHGTADEYATVPGARYEILVHDGSYAEIFRQISAARDAAAQAIADGEPPTVLIVNSMTSLWDWIRTWAQHRVHASLENRRRLQSDPFAEVSLGDSGWNEANARHARVMRLLLTYPGIVVMTARGKWITPASKDGVPDGPPFYKVDAHKSVCADASCWIRLDREAPPLIVGARAPQLDLGGEPLALDKDWSLDWLLFDLLGLDSTQTQTRPLVLARTERTPQQIAAEAVTADLERLGELLGEVRDLGYDDVAVPNERRKTESLTEMITRLGHARRPDAPATPQHHNRLKALWRSTGDFSDDAARAAFVREITGRNITSAAALTNAEADRVIERLTAYLQQSTPSQAVPDRESHTTTPEPDYAGASE
ncbi:hypothetical protein [Spirillospora sp. CA-294931]|uniref:hypothetical protein n=1 Tax=Spirillospora sp. CA-294931 TaxID=3240042 RepID=UPI003D93111A